MENEKFQELVLGKLGDLESDIGSIDSRLDGIDSRLDEHSQLLQALLHASEVHKADIDNLANQIAKIAGSQERQERIMEMLSLRSIESEAQIRELKLAK